MGPDNYRGYSHALKVENKNKKNSALGEDLVYGGKTPARFALRS